LLSLRLVAARITLSPGFEDASLEENRRCRPSRIATVMSPAAKALGARPVWESARGAKDTGSSTNAALSFRRAAAAPELPAVGKQRFGLSRSVAPLRRVTRRAAVQTPTPLSRRRGTPATSYGLSRRIVGWGCAPGFDGRKVSIEPVAAPTGGTVSWESRAVLNRLNGGDLRRGSANAVLAVTVASHRWLRHDQRRPSSTRSTSASLAARLGVTTRTAAFSRAELPLPCPMTPGGSETNAGIH